MAITKEQKLLFESKIKPYKDFIISVDHESSSLKGLLKKNKNIEPYISIKNAILSVQKANTLLLMSRLSMEIQQMKIDSHLTEARKIIANTLNDLIRLAGDEIEESLTENKERLSQIEKLTPGQKLNLLQGLREVTQSINNELGNNSKWRWSFPDLHYKIAVIARNMFDFRAFERAKDPNYPDYIEMQQMLQFVIEEAQYAAQEFRSRFELSTNDVNDLHQIRRLLESIKKIHLLTGNKGELTKIQTAIDANEQKIEAMMAGKKKKKG
jgi:hypothetical protein